MSRYLIGCKSKDFTGLPMCSTGNSGLDNEDYCVSLENVPCHLVPEVLTDAKTTALFFAGLANAYLNEVSVTDLTPEQICEMGMKEEHIGVIHPDNPELPF